jgi:hypothetical protein
MQYCLFSLMNILVKVFDTVLLFSFCFFWSWSWSCSCGRQSVDQFVWVSGLPLGPLTRFYITLLFSADNYFILLSKASSLTRKRVCSLQCNHSLVPITVLYRLIWDWVPFLSPLTTRRDYGGGILTRHHTGLFFWEGGGGGAVEPSPLSLMRLLAYCTFAGCWMMTVWDNQWNKSQEKLKNVEKSCQSAALYTTNPTWPDQGLNPGDCDGKLASNRLN